jgi:hypothetical protein
MVGEQQSETWTSRRLEIRAWLTEHALPLEGVFSAAVELLARPAVPARVHLLGHCVREI